MLGQNKKNKKGFVFTVTVIFFVITVLIFSIVIYRYTQEREELLIDDSISLKIINQEDSIQQAIKNIFLIDYDLYLKTNITNDYRLLQIITTLKSNGKTQKLLNSSLDNLSYAIDSFYSDSSINTTKIKNDPRLYINPNLIIEKKTLDNSNNMFQEIIFYYNESGTNDIPFENISIYINSSDNYFHILNTTQNPIGNAHNLFIETLDFNGTTGIGDEIKKNITIPFSTLTSHKWAINNSDNTTTFLNITLDNEKISIAINSGNAKVKVKYQYNNTNITPYLYHKERNLFTLNNEEYQVSKKSMFKSSFPLVQEDRGRIVW